MSELKQRVASGMAWSLAEKVGTTLLQLGVSLVLLSLLSPENYKVLALLTALSVVALVIVDSGFSQILIRKAEPTEDDYKSVFIFNMSVAVALYAAIVAAAPWIGSYYMQHEFAKVAPLFFLLLPLSAATSIQLTIFTRQFRFALLSKLTFAASAVSGAVAVGMALAGCGLWSIVAQRVIYVAVRGGAMWFLSDWHPSGRFSRKALGEMAPNSFRLMGTDLIAALYTKIPQLFIGRIYAASNSLAYFDQAQKLKDAPVMSMVAAVQSVTYPAVSKIADQREKFAESYRQIIMVVAYVMFPVMLGLAAVAEQLFTLLGAKWIPTVPYFEVICGGGLFHPLAVIAYNVLKVKSDGRIIIRLEIVKKIVMTAIFALTIPHSVMAVVWGLVAIAAMEFMVNFVATCRFTDLTVWRMLRTLMPVALVSAAMYAGVELIAAWLPPSPLTALAIKIVGGILIYIVLSAAFRLEAFLEVKALIQRQLSK